MFTGGDHLLLPRPGSGLRGHRHRVREPRARGCSSNLYEAFRAGNRAEAERLQTLAGELGGVIMAHTFPSVIKEAMTMAGVPMGPCRKPVGPMPAGRAPPRSRLSSNTQTEGYCRAPSRSARA